MTKGQAGNATNKKQFLALLKEVDLKKDKSASVAGEIGERIKHAVENAHLNRAAFGMIMRLYRMDEEKREDFIRSFDLYREYCEEAKLFGEEHTGDFFDDKETDDTGDKAEPDTAESDAEVGAKNAAKVAEGIRELTPEEREFDDATSSKPSRRRQADPLSGAETTGSYKYKN